MATFITPFSGTAELTASNGLTIVSQGSWRFSQAGYNDGATFGVSMGGPVGAGTNPFVGPSTPPVTIESGELHLSAQDWSIAVVGNELTSYEDPNTSTVYPASKCRIQIVGYWNVIRRPNSNSFNSIGVIYSGTTDTDEGRRTMNPFLLNFVATPSVTYTIQGSGVDGGAVNNFSGHLFYCRINESVTTDNSNREFQSNSIARPVWSYSYTKSWQTD